MSIEKSKKTKKNKITKYIIIVVMVLLLLIVGVIFMNLFIKKKEVSETIDSYINENNYESHIQEKEILYDWKQGTYYGKVTFEDEPENYYEIYVNGNSDNVYVFGYNNNTNVEITNKNEGRYIDN
ncbi:MAG: DUF3139 domain-containing protein [Bacillota bacterium]|uniref:DUF3139 domain-containing protein n=1 Tax=unclassified Virgibacillus TaxID=2620237 RepID=UPI001D15EC9C|nr:MULTISPECIES: DUF3139 domain-containing protein [unclassified Virgibacillus]MCC2252350.1 DUF3139 domain-containing protein [Virgibacillus sp. AGTR]MDY7044872.1 DUF3139 domain-containing protein [Virgibacillus sp. M23]